MVRKYALRTLMLISLVALGYAGLGGATVSPVAAQTASVSIANFAFSPATLTIAAGTTVTWTNKDTAPHTATSDSQAWTTPTLQTGQSGSVTFKDAGTFTYHCSVHPFMKATIIVQAPAGGVPLAAKLAPVTVQAKEVNQHYVFGPATKRIKVGQTVIWKNTSDAGHTVTSTTKGWTYNRMLNEDKSVRYTFMKAGTFHYKCVFHSGMVGTIIVTK